MGSQATALAIYRDAPQFTPPARERGASIRQLTAALFAELPIAREQRVPTAGECQRLAHDSQTALHALASKVTDFFSAIFRSGVRPSDDWRNDLAAPAASAALAVVRDRLPVVTRYNLIAMPLAERATASAEQVFHYYREDARKAARAAAKRVVDGLDELVRMMAVGLLERVADGAVRVRLCRETAAAGDQGGTRSPRWPAGVTHPFVEDGDAFLARLHELVEVRPTDPFPSYRLAPQRVRDLLAAVPQCLRPFVSGFTGLLVRDASARVDPHGQTMDVRDGVANGRLNAVVFGSEYVLATWRDDENTSLFTRLFGV